MAAGERYIEFMEQETNLANQERLSFGNVEQVAALIDMASKKEGPEEIESYILKNIQLLFSYAPHLSIQLYLASLTARNLQYDVLGRLEGLLKREDLPAKSFGIINGYISVLKTREMNPPSSSFASDIKIAEAVDAISPQNLSRIVFSLQVRLETDASMDHFVDLLNPFMRSPSKDPIYKITLLQQLAALAKKHPASKPFDVYIDGEEYYVLLDGSLDESSDTFVRAVEYYIDSLSLKGNLREILNSFALMYRTLHYNSDHLLNNEADIKSFCAGLIEAYNLSVGPIAPKAVFKFDFPESYKSQEGYKEAMRFLKIAFRPRFS